MNPTNQHTALQMGSNGFLETPRIDGVSAVVKANIVENYSRSGNLTTACRENGVDPRIMRIHYNSDPAFKRAIDEAREQICDKAEGHIVEHMSRPGNVIDRLSWLRAHRPGKWNPTANIQVTVDREKVQQLAEQAKQYVETTASAVDGTAASVEGLESTPTPKKE